MKNLILTLLTIAIIFFGVALIDSINVGAYGFNDLSWWGQLFTLLFLSTFAMMIYFVFFHGWIVRYYRKIKDRK